MLTDALIISLSRNFWDDVWRSRQQVMSRLARQNQVVFVSRPLTVDEARPGAAASSQLRRAGAHRVTDRLTAWVPPRHLPSVFSLPAVESLLDSQRRSALRRFTRRYPNPTRVLYLWHPAFERYIDTFPGAIVCYHLFDDLSAYGKEQDATARALERIFARADVVFVASEELADRYRSAGNVHWIPNGVDYEAYPEPGVDVPVPADLAAVPRPRLGYAGSLRNQIDIDLMQRLAEARRDWHLVLVGDVSAGVQQSAAFASLRAQPNVHVLGQKSRQEMPAYMRGLDLGLLPYRLDGAARYCYPLKMHEYLAAGLPVVSSDLCAVQPHTDVIRIARSFDEWVRAIDTGLRDRGATEVQARRDVARANSWDGRVARISTLIAEAALRRPPAPR